MSVLLAMALMLAVMGALPCVRCAGQQSPPSRTQLRGRRRARLRRGRHPPWRERNHPAGVQATRVRLRTPGKGEDPRPQ